MNIFFINDWAGNRVFGRSFLTFDDAEEFISMFLGDTYDEDRQEYEIIEK